VCRTLVRYSFLHTRTPCLLLLPLYMPYTLCVCDLHLISMLFHPNYGFTRPYTGVGGLVRLCGGTLFGLAFERCLRTLRPVGIALQAEVVYWFGTLRLRVSSAACALFPATADLRAALRRGFRCCHY